MFASYENLPYVLPEALKEEHAKVETLETRLATLEQRLTQLETSQPNR